MVRIWPFVGLILLACPFIHVFYDIAITNRFRLSRFCRILYQVEVLFELPCGGVMERESRRRVLPSPDDGQAFPPAKVARPLSDSEDEGPSTHAAPPPSVPGPSGEPDVHLCSSIVRNPPGFVVCWWGRCLQTVTGVM